MTPKHARNPFNLKKALMVSVGVIFLFLLVCLVFLLQPAYSAAPESISFVQTALAKQQRIEADLRATYQAGKFTFQDPLIIQDPYQIAPLTALLIFDTPENSQISIHIPGKTPEAAVDFTFAGYQQHHEIPVYGLYADMLNRLTLSLKTENGKSEQNEIDLQTEALPVSFPTFTIDFLDRARYSPGFNFTFLDQKPVFDLDGNVRWYSTQPSFAVFTKLENGRFLFTYTINDKTTIIMEQDLLGKIYSVYNIPDGIHHDIYELPNGNLLMASSDLKSPTVDDYIIEVDRGNGHIVRSFDLKNILDPGRPTSLGMPAKDWLHLNSIVYDPIDRSIIISSYSQSAVIKMSYPGMKIQWILGPHANWSKKYQPYLLTPVGANFAWAWSQHHATLYSPDNPGSHSIDLLLFDNGQNRSFDPKNAVPPTEWYSRVVHYHIDEAAKTVQQVWEYRQENGAAIFSGTYGSAYVLSNGDVLGTWGDIYKDAQGIPAVNNSSEGTTNTKIIEVDPSKSGSGESANEVVFECSVPNTSTYRTMRAGIYTGYSDNNSYLSTQANNTTGNDLTDRSVLAWRDVRRWTITPAMEWLKMIVHQILSMVR